MINVKPDLVLPWVKTAEIYIDITARWVCLSISQAFHASKSLRIECELIHCFSFLIEPDIYTLILIYLYLILIFNLCTKTRIHSIRSTESPCIFISNALPVSSIMLHVCTCIIVEEYVCTLFFGECPFHVQSAYYFLGSLIVLLSLLLLLLFEVYLLTCFCISWSLYYIYYSAVYF